MFGHYVEDALRDTYQDGLSEFAGNLAGPWASAAVVPSPLVLDRTLYQAIFERSRLVVDHAVGAMRKRVVANPLGRAAGSVARYVAPDHLPSHHTLADLMVAGRYCRPDIVISQGQPWIVELNFNSILSGQAQQAELSRRFFERIPTKESSNYYADNVYFARRRIFSDLLGGAGVDAGSMLFLVLATDRERGFGPYVDSEIRWQREHGISCTATDPLEGLVEVGADGNFIANGRRYTAAVRLFNHHKAIEHGYPATMLKTLESGPRYFAGGASDVVSSNALLCFLFEDMHELPHADAEAIRSCLPWTSFLDANRPRPDGPGSLHDYVLEYQEDLVIKPLVGSQGQSVLIGCGVDGDEWRQRVEIAMTSGLDCVQHYVAPDEDPFPVLSAGGRADEVSGSMVLGPFLADGHPGGMVVRHTPTATASTSAPVNWGIDHIMNVAICTAQ